MAVHDAAKAAADKPGIIFYPPGWADRFIDRIDSLPIPAWAFYLAVWLTVFAIETGVNWYTGVYPPGTLFPYHLIFTGLVVYGLALVHYFDRVAVDSLKAFKPAFTGDDADYARWQYELTTMPARQSALACVVGIGLGLTISAYFANAQTLSLTKLVDSDVSTVLNISLFSLVYTVQGIYAYHTIRQLRLVSRLFATSVRVDLFRRGPLYAFSGLSARTALSLAILPYAGILSRPGVTENPAVVWGVIILTIMGLVIFVWPLLGVHRLMEAEKRRLLDENGQRMQAAIEETHKRLESHDLAGIDDWKAALDSLVTEQDLVSKISTWPWQLGTVSLLATALFLPVLLWGIERLLERVLGF